MPRKEEKKEKKEKLSKEQKIERKRQRKEGEPLPIEEIGIPIQIDNSANSNALTEHQIKVIVDTQSTISTGEMHPNGDDIRFVDSDGNTYLSYWIESGINTAETKIWVKVPSIPGAVMKTIHMEYGQDDSGPMSSGQDTFMLFDDFNDGIYTDKWTNPHPQGNYSESGGLIKLQSAGYCSLDSIKRFTGPCVLETRVQRFTGYDYRVNIVEYSKDNEVELGIGNYGRNFVIRKRGVDFGGEKVMFLDGSNNDWKEYSGQFYGNKWNVYRGPILENWDRNDTVEFDASADGREYYARIFTHEAGDSGANWDWIRVRNFALPEPTITIQQ